MNHKKAQKKAKQIQNKIRTILLSDWDPIGVSDIPEAQDEYDEYIGKIYGVLSRTKSEEKLFELLCQIETEYMELECNKESLRTVARKLLEVDISF